MQIVSSSLKTKLNLALPIFLGQIGFTINGLCDNLMVSKLGILPLASFSLANNLLFIFFSFNLGFTLMITPLISQKYHENKFEDIGHLLFNGSILYFFVGFLLFTFLIFIGNNLNIFGQTQEVINYTKPYFRIISYSFIPSALFQVLKQFSDGMEKTKQAMYPILFTIILNIFLNYILIFGKFGFNRFGLMGSAYGSLFSRCLLFIILLITLLYSSKTKIVLKNYFSNKFCFASIKQIFKLSTFSSFQIFFKIILITSTVILAGRFGSLLQAGNQIILSIYNLLFAVPFSLAVASAITVTRNPSKTKFLKITLFSFIKISITFIIPIVVFITILKTQIVSLYTNSQTLAQSVYNVFIFLFIFYIFDSIETIILGTLRGLKETIYPFFMTSSVYIFISIPLSFVFIQKMALNGIWLGLSIGSFVSLFLLLLRFRFLIKK